MTEGKTIDVDKIYSVTVCGCRGTSKLMHQFTTPDSSVDQLDVCSAKMSRITITEEGFYETST